MWRVDVALADVAVLMWLLTQHWRGCWLCWLWWRGDTSASSTSWTRAGAWSDWRSVDALWLARVARTGSWDLRLIAEKCHCARLDVNKLLVCSKLIFENFSETRIFRTGSHSSAIQPPTSNLSYWYHLLWFSDHSRVFLRIKFFYYLTRIELQEYYKTLYKNNLTTTLSLALLAWSSLTLSEMNCWGYSEL